MRLALLILGAGGAGSLVTWAAVTPLKAAKPNPRPLGDWETGAPSWEDGWDELYRSARRG